MEGSASHNSLGLGALTGNQLRVFHIGIDTHQEPVVYMRRDCHICRAEGFSASTRVRLQHGDQQLLATLNVVDEQVLPEGSAGLSDIAMERLKVQQDDLVLISHSPLLHSLRSIRKKIFGHKLSEAEITNIIADISAHYYTDIEIASFITACAGGRLDVDEIIDLTNAMVSCGKRLQWPGHPQILDKHCIGGLPGNRTTPLIVAIVSAAGLVIPKTSSRAITSPAGSADTLEVLTNVDLTLEAIQQTVTQTHACLAWGGSVNLSPADDLLIRIERSLDLDGEGQLIASVLSKKLAAGATHVIIDIPVGETAKVRTQKEANRLASLFTQVGAACGIEVRCLITDGSQPVGRGIGPVEEAKDVLAVLRGDEDAPGDLRERALYLCAELFSLVNKDGFDAGYRRAEALLDSGQAWQQFNRIVAAQGGLKAIPCAELCHEEFAQVKGVISAIDNRQLARLAKLAGAPSTPEAGLRLHIRVGDRVSEGDPLFTLYSGTEGERDYALDYYRHATIFALQEPQ